MLVGIWLGTSNQWTGAWMGDSACNTTDINVGSTEAGSNNPADGVWTSHIAIFDAAAPAHQKFIDGQTNGAQTDTWTSFTTAPDRIAIGATGDSSPSIPANGAVAWPCIWDVILTAAERAALDAGVHPLLIRSASIIWFCGDMHRNGGEIDIIGGRNLTETGTVATVESPLLFLAGPSIITRQPSLVGFSYGTIFG